MVEAASKTPGKGSLPIEYKSLIPPTIMIKIVKEDHNNKLAVEEISLLPQSKPDQLVVWEVVSLTLGEQTHAQHLDLIFEQTP